jgi:hypothetical protein
MRLAKPWMSGTRMLKIGSVNSRSAVVNGNCIGFAYSRTP